MRFYLVLICLSTYFNLHAQEIQWASEVLEVSSEFSEPTDSTFKQFKAFQVLGKPSVLPSFENSPCAWTSVNSIDSIMVGYKKPIRINHVVINQNRRSGFIKNVVIIDTAQKATIVYEQKEFSLSEEGKLLNINFPLSEYPICAVKIILHEKEIRLINDDSRVKRIWNHLFQIDAIGIAKREADYLPNIPVIYRLGEIEKAENLGKNINSGFEEIAPNISPDGNTLFFTRSKHPKNMGIDKKQDVWFADLQGNSTFSIAKNMGPPVNNEFHNSLFSCNNQGRLLLNNYYGEDSAKVIVKKGVSISYRYQDFKTSKKKWSFPQKLNIENYYNRNTYSEFNLSANDSILLMTAERDDSFGGKDIYVSFKIGKNSYSEPLNLGSTINTADGETSPFLSKNGRLLFFSTAGHLGFGSNDIFVSRRLDNTWTRWSVPQNLGEWINTPKWDAYISIPDSGDYVYFSSYANSLGGGDIFRIKLSEENKLKLLGQK